MSIHDDEIPVIAISPFQQDYTQEPCQGCGTRERERVAYTLRASQNFTTTMLWCVQCRIELVHFFLLAEPPQAQTTTEREEAQQRIDTLEQLLRQLNRALYYELEERTKNDQ